LTPIAHEQGQQLAKEIGAAAYAECSARTQKGLKECFNSCIESVLKPKIKDVPRKEPGCLIL